MGKDWLSGFYCAGEKIMDFINSLDTESMSAKDVRSAVYAFCLKLLPDNK